MELEKKIDALGVAFEEFKKANDKRIDEIKTKGFASSDTETKVAKVEKDIDTLTVQIDGMKAAIARTGGNGGAPEVSPELKQKAEYKAAIIGYMRKGMEIPKALVDMAAKAMSVDSDPAGGFLVDPETSSEIVKLVHESSPIRQLASVQAISSASLKMNADLDRPASGWVGERQSRTASTPPSVRQVEIFAHEMYCYPEATQAFLDDAAINVEAWLSQFCGMAFSLDEATAFVNGSGSGQPRGILNYASGTAFGNIERATSEGTGALVANDLIALQTLLKEPYQKGASWIINRALIGVIRKIKDVTSGQYIWAPGLSQSTPNILLGQPLYFGYDLSSSVATASADVLLYGDFKAGYQIVDRVGIRVLRDPYSNKPNVGFYTTKRVGGGVKNFEAIKVLRMHA